MLQDHFCHLVDDHAPGLECLSDPLMLPLLLAMDSDTLINCGKASPRLLRLVCDREVWTWMLKGIAEFIDEKLEELLAVFGSRRSTEMMSEGVKEAASRHTYLIFVASISSGASVKKNY